MALTNFFCLPFAAVSCCLPHTLKGFQHPQAQHQPHCCRRVWVLLAHGLVTKITLPAFMNPNMHLWLASIRRAPAHGYSKVPAPVPNHKTDIHHVNHVAAQSKQLKIKVLPTNSEKDLFGINYLANNPAPQIHFRKP